MCLGSDAVIWSATSAIAVWPHGLAYVNGSRRTTDGHRLRATATTIGGRPQRRAAWQRRAADRGCPWYFGTDPRAQRAPFQLVALHDLPTGSPEEVRALVQGRFLAVGTTLLYGTSLSPSHARAAAFLRTQTAAARTPTFFIYDFGSSAANKSDRP
jgi:hypothetical protein